MKNNISTAESADQGNHHFTEHFEKTVSVPAQPSEVFAFIDDHVRFSSHMSESSWMMGGGKMTVDLDEDHGQAIGSHIKMSGKAFGMSMSLDEVVTDREPPNHKAWETVGKQRLLIIGNYRMGVRISPEGGGSVVTVFIDYNPSPEHAILSSLFAHPYARWCVDQMASGIVKEFAAK